MLNHINVLDAFNAAKHKYYSFSSAFPDAPRTISMATFLPLIYRFWNIYAFSMDAANMALLLRVCIYVP